MQLIPGEFLGACGARYRITNGESGKQVKWLEKIIVMEGRGVTCFRDFFIIDMSLDKPYVSNRFGPNPDGKYCLSCTRAKWGNSESYIYLNKSLKYYYRAGGKVIGPVD